MNQAIHLTPFEEQILQALRVKSSPSPKSYCHVVYQDCSSQDIHIAGIVDLQYSKQWSGPEQHRITWVAPTYPRINFALGHLAKKGLVERIDWPALAGRYTAGRWRLTDLGKNIMGVAS